MLITILMLLCPASCAVLQAFVDVIDQMKADMYLAPHIRYYMREIRVVAYSQVGLQGDDTGYLATSYVCRLSGCVHSWMVCG